MTDVIDYKIFGDDMQLVEVELDPGEGVRAEAGAMMYMVEDIEMQTSTGGGLFKGFKRMITGESFRKVSFKNLSVSSPCSRNTSMSGISQNIRRFKICFWQ